MRSLVQPGSQAEMVGRLFLAVIVVVALPALPFGNYLIYPFMILTTWFHEMGHGLTALLLGHHFERLVIYPSGSGVAESFIAGDASRLTRAAIAAGGPLAPSLVGAVLILASAHPRAWRPALWAMAGAIALSVLVYVRSMVGVIVLPLVAALIALIAARAPAGFVRFSLQFLGVLGAMSMLRDFDYLFTERTVIAGQAMLSDTGQIEAALGLPHWVWAGLILGVSALMIGASLRYALAEKRLRAVPKRLPPNVVRFRRPRR
ncbi:M50 family metallopeptidase [Erythrobacter sp. HL-111]|uniref:M50 family metallopeptidase n=1 Tax=Erythrobacter sp. HL-111 TaxID=1798193 RepID=UPI0006DA9FA2|nr:M50 family metallopeptidase [Erythrobacter sp. HL-111]KPP94798.1 MAG: Peptidase M50B-like protein [Erythrobacteraceae bacterium HL-111]SDS85667.1 Peptidase M50B-like [Erythrobacter sp. HL-111]